MLRSVSRKCNFKLAQLLCTDKNQLAIIWNPYHTQSFSLMMIILKSEHVSKVLYHENLENPNGKIFEIDWKWDKEKLWYLGSVENKLYWWLHLRDLVISLFTSFRFSSTFLLPFYIFSLEHCSVEDSFLVKKTKKQVFDLL